MGFLAGSCSVLAVAILASAARTQLRRRSRASRLAQSRKCGRIVPVLSPVIGRAIMPAASSSRRSTPIRCGITFIGHATFLIESPQLVRIATDYNDYVQAAGACPTSSP